MTRLLKGLGSLVALAVMLVGLPWLLIQVGSPLLPDTWSWTHIQQILTTPDTTGATLAWLVTAAAWVAWAVFAATTVLELVALLTRQRVRLQLPGLGGAHQLVAALLVSVIALGSIAALHPTPAAAEPAPTPPITTSNPAQHPPPPATPTKSGQNPAVVVHTVTAGDSLWQLADHYLGDGDRYPEIAHLNKISDPDWIDIGQKLQINTAATHTTQPTAHDTPTTQQPHPDTPTTTVRHEVRAGDTLWKIAAQHLGAGDRYLEIATYNHLSNPDRIDIGQIITVPGVPTTVAPEQTTPPVSDTPQPETPQPETPRPPASTPTSAPTQPSVSPTSSAPSSVTPSTSRPSSSAGEAPGQAVAADADRGGVVAAASVAAVGMLLTAGLLTALDRNRRRQLRRRPVGHRIPTPDAEAHAVETALRVSQGDHDWLTVDSLNLVLRAISRDTAGAPPLLACRVATDRIDLLLSEARPEAPAGVEVIADGSVWTVHAEGADELVGDPATASRIAAPYPALVTLGADADGAQVLLNLETVGSLTITSADPVAAEAALAAVTMSLALAPWIEDLNVTVVGDTCPGLVDALAEPTVTNVASIDEVLDALEARALEQREQLAEGPTLGQNRADPRTSDGWEPEVVVTSAALSDDEQTRLRAVIDELPRVALAAVTIGDSPLTDYVYTVGDGGHLAPLDWELVPHRIPDELYQSMVSLLQTSTSGETTRASWWSDADPSHDPVDDAALDEPDPEPERLGNVRRIRPRLSIDSITAGRDLTPTTFTDWDPDETPDTEAPATAVVDAEPGAAEVRVRDRLIDITDFPAPTRSGPQLRILGPVQLDGAAGKLTRGGASTCMELLLYINMNPGCSSEELAAGTCVSGSSVKPMVSNLRNWLGATPEGELYLPRSSGRGYVLHPAVTTDWDVLRSMTDRPCTDQPTDTLVSALQLVSGRPLAGRVRGRFGFADLVTTEIVTVVTDLALILAARATHRHDYQLARWAIGKGLLVDPYSEPLLAAKIRTEHAAGDHDEVLRLADQINANAANDVDDLLPETLSTLRAVGCVQ